MNSNSDINNMAKRYKEEMMRLYHRSTASDNRRADNSHAETAEASAAGGASASNNTGAQNMNSASRTVDAQKHDKHEDYRMKNDTGTTGSAADIPVTCRCRFPSAESIINEIAGTPAPLPAAKGDTDFLTPSGRMSTPSQTAPNTAAANQSQPPQNGDRTYSVGSSAGELRDSDRMAQNQNGTGNTLTSPIVTGNTDTPVANTSQNSALKGIMINSTPDEFTFDPNLENEQQQEILPDFELPPDIPADSDAKLAVISVAGYHPSQGWQTSTGDSSWGYLQFEVFTAGGAYPIQGAVVTIKRRLSGGVALARVLFTNRSGKTATIALPAPPKSYSQSPGNSRPFAEYDVTVYANGYYTLRDINMPIFAGVKTVQPIDMIPLPQHPGGSLIQPRNDSTNVINDTADVG